MSTVIVGAGIAGLTAAWQLVLSGEDPASVTVLESADRVGGKLARAEVAGHLVDVGAESMLAVRPEAPALVRELGLGDALTSPATTSASVWSRGRLWPLPTGTLMGVPSDPESVRGLLSDAEVARLGDERPWPGPLAGDVAVGEYLATRLGDAVVDRLVEPLLGGVYAAQARRLSMAAAVPALYAAAQRGESMLGAAAAAGAARAGTRPGASAFCGIVGGVGRLAEELRDALLSRGVAIETGVIVRELTRTGPGWELVTGPVPAPDRVTADSVVLAVPAPAAARLLARAAPGASAVLAEVEVASIAVITLALDRRDLFERGCALPGSGFLVPATEGRTIKASTFSSGKWAWVDDLSDDLLFARASIGRAGEVAALQRPDEELADIAVTEMGEAVGFKLPRVVDRHVQRWGGGLPQYAVGHLARMTQVEAAIAGVPGLEVCGAAYGGVGIPAVIASARAAADRLLSSKGLS
ncbi:MAG: protoporphyrinogen oxidase [Intrasporangiaceae bacterium]|nr:protoporphyrinogen oxidase [Intrasporangiaceae bacterium]